MNLEGVLFFPVTPYNADGGVDTGLLTEHLQTRLEDKPGGIFAACGTGEFHSLSVDEVATVLKASVSATNGAVPTFGGTGGPLGHAIACAKAAAEAGVDGLLVLPPYLVGSPAQGLINYVNAITAATELPVIVYHRANASFTPAVIAELAKNPKIIGFKDGVGDIALSQQVVLTAKQAGREDFLFFNGLLTAELTQAAYRGIGIPLYSSAVFAMAPKIANAFYAAYTAGDEERREFWLNEFYRPLVSLRDKVPGYAVALIKAGVRMGGLPVGGVRPPLLDPTSEHEAELRRLLDRGAELAS